MARRLTYAFVKESFESDGYTLLSEEYKNSYTKLKYRCPVGHEHSIKWDHWKNGHRCPYCDGQVKPPIDFIRSEFEKGGYVLISKEYVNNRTKLRYVCPKGHKHSICWSNWQQGCRCPYCAGVVSPTIEFIQTEFEKVGYNLLSQVYVDAKSKLDYVCPHGHTHSITWCDWCSGNRCPYCANRPPISIAWAKSSFEKEGYTLLSEKYINAHALLKYKCSYGHEHFIRWYSWQNGNRCPTCYKLNNFGEHCSSWRGGKSFEEYCEVWKDRDFKIDIRERDENKCLNPYCSSRDPNDLTIHHIDYDKKNCHPKNLITVCRSCNGRANTDRPWHKAWYQAVLNKRYNYKY